MGHSARVTGLAALLTLTLWGASRAEPAPVALTTTRPTVMGQWVPGPVGPNCAWDVKDDALDASTTGKPAYQFER